MRRSNRKIWSVRERVGIGSEHRQRRPTGEMRREGMESEGGKLRVRTRGEKKEAGGEIVIQIKYPGIETTGGKILERGEDIN